MTESATDEGCVAISSPKGVRSFLRRSSSPLLLATAAVLVIAQLAGAQDSGQQAPTIVGSDECAICHEDVAKAFQQNPHWSVERGIIRNWENRRGQVCETCHGPGSVHVDSTSAEDILNPPRMTPAEADRTCLACHLNQPAQAGRIQSGHAKNQTSCTACHSMHQPGAESVVARKASTINKQCTGCHISQWADFQKPHTHRLPEGAMSCVDCHDPHGSFLSKSMQTAFENERGCLKCHGDKRGPFAFEHAPVRVEGCSTCHESHGSANPGMLTRQEVSLQCLECHADVGAPVTNAQTGALGGLPPAFHDLRSSRYRNCTICHVKIHGSNVNRALLR